MLDPVDLLMVAVGGALGGAGRYWVAGVVDRRVGELFPWGTLVVNVTGAAAIGMLAAGFLTPGDGTVAATRGAPIGVEALGPVWLFLAVGILGSYTTVSSFSLQTLALIRTGEARRAALNVALSVLLCLTGAVAGYAGGRLLLFA